MPDFAHKGTVPCTVPVVVGTKERRKERGSKGKFVCVFRGSTKFKASDLTFISGKGQMKRESVNCRSFFLLKCSVQLNAFCLLLIRYFCLFVSKAAILLLQGYSVVVFWSWQ